MLIEASSTRELVGRSVLNFRTCSQQLLSNDSSARRKHLKPYSIVVSILAGLEEELIGVDGIYGWHVILAKLETAADS